MPNQRLPPTHAAPVPLGRAYDTLDRIQDVLQTIAQVSWTAPAGAARRGVDLVDHVLLVAATDRPALVFEAIGAIADGAVAQQEESLFTAEVERVSATVRCVPIERAGAELLHATGSAIHLEGLRDRARRLGHVLDPTGLRAGPGGRRIAETEEAIYEKLELPFVPPELRNGDGELAAAEQRSLPRLVSTGDIRGDLHMHSLWSDGRDTIEAMVVSAIGLGYEYIAITDHSPSSAASRSLTLDGVARQAEEIASLRTSYPQVAILHGCEVDILEDGSLDFPDLVLERFDIVLASLHERHGHDPAMLLTRYERAMRHPLVALITHPTNRVLPHRAGYELDYERLFELAVETGTLLEIDGGPSHLDLDASLARRASRAGVTLTIDSDCHIASRLGRQMHLGVTTARRGWVEAGRVMNTKPLSEVRARIAGKRGGRLG